MQNTQRIVLWALISCLLGGVFLLYTQSDFLVQLSNQIWACF